jgi:hypothetical protein
MTAGHAGRRAGHQSHRCSGLRFPSASRVVSSIICMRKTKRHHRKWSKIPKSQERHRQIQQYLRYANTSAWIPDRYCCISSLYLTKHPGTIDIPQAHELQQPIRSNNQTHGSQVAEGTLRHSSLSTLTSSRPELLHHFTTLILGEVTMHRWRAVRATPSPQRGLTLQSFCSKRPARRPPPAARSDRRLSNGDGETGVEMDDVHFGNGLMRIESP